MERVFGSSTSSQAEAVAYLKNYYATLVAGSRTAGRYPLADGEYGFHAFTTRSEHTAAQSARIEGMLLGMAGTSGASPALTAEDLKELVTDPDAPASRVADVVDALLEEADLQLDAARGASGAKAARVRQGALSGGAGGAAGAGASAGAAAGSGTLVDGKARRGWRNRIPRPQDSFAEAVDNSRAPFVPRIKHKYNAKAPLPVYTQQPEGTAPAAYVHPYEVEVRDLTYAPWMVARREAQPPKPLQETPFTWVDTPEALTELVDDLTSDAVKELAIDLEHHSAHSFQGFTCLMQLSTRTADYIVDTLALRQHLHELNRVFTDPAVVKVLHGCDRDVVWLQADFGVYLVNVFDTGQAARVLQYPSFGLAHLLQTFCGVTANKALQRADWRVRPLPSNMMHYAREDTHYLLYIYDMMLNQLLDAGTAMADDGISNLLRATLSRSEDLCLSKYEKPQYGPDAHMRLLSLLGLAAPVGTLADRRRRVFAALYGWRDATARALDEGVNAVLHHKAMRKLAIAQPTTTQGLVQTLTPLPPHVRTRAHEVLEVIVAARNATGSGLGTTAPLREQSVTPRNTASSAASRRSSARSRSSASASPSPTTPNIAAAGGGAAAASGAAAGKSSFVPLTPPADLRGAVMSPTPSPVLTTDQLYRHAGWLQSPDLMRPRRTTLISAPVGSVATAAAAATATASAPQAPAKAVVVVADTSSATDVGRRLAIKARIQASLQSAMHVYGASVAHTELRGASPSLPVAQAAQAADSSAGRAADVTMRSPQPGARAPSPVTMTAGGVSGGGAGTGAGAGAAGEAVPPGLRSSSIEDAIEVPKSLAEIYQISNRNRKRNKVCPHARL